MQAEDTDYHILRDKKAVGDTSGIALLLDGNLSYNLSSESSLFFNATYSKIETNGQQDQYWYDGSNHVEKSIDHKINLKEYKLIAGLNFKI